MMKKKAYFLPLLVCSVGALIFTSCTSSKSTASKSNFRVILGDEQFEEYEPLLKDRRVALFSNHSGIVGDKITLSDGSVQYGGFVSSDKNDLSLIPFGKDLSGKPVAYGEHVLDSLLSHGINVTTIFCPEHGFRGTEDAGATISHSVDEKTGIPIRSLYEDDTRHTINWSIKSAVFGANLLWKRPSLKAIRRNLCCGLRHFLYFGRVSKSKICRKRLGILGEYPLKELSLD